MVSAGSGPSRINPSARRRARSGIIISISCRPMAPPSPAWGFSPATARRGEDRAKSCRSARSVIRIVRSSRSRVSAAGTSARGIWIVVGTTRSCGTGQHHHHGAPRPAPPGYSVWPGKAKSAPSFSTFLLIGAVQTAPASPDITSETARVDHRDHVAGIPGIRPAGTGRGGEGMMQHGQGTRRHGYRLRGMRDDLMRRVRRQVPWVADPEERDGSADFPACLHGDFGSDPRRFAAGQRDRSGRGFHGSRITAAARSLRR